VIIVARKRIIGYYLDGRVSAVVGDHWHVPTSDAMVLPKGTAHMTDVGMCGSLHSSLGVSIDSVVAAVAGGCDDPQSAGARTSLSVQCSTHYY
jgi:calcineurin-like phosphoesterase